MSEEEEYNRQKRIIQQLEDKIRLWYKGQESGLELVESAEVPGHNQIHKSVLDELARLNVAYSISGSKEDKQAFDRLYASIQMDDSLRAEGYVETIEPHSNKEIKQITETSPANQLISRYENKQNSPKRKELLQGAKNVLDHYAADRIDATEAALTILGIMKQYDKSQGFFFNIDPFNIELLEKLPQPVQEKINEQLQRADPKRFANSEKTPYPRYNLRRLLRKVALEPRTAQDISTSPNMEESTQSPSARAGSDFEGSLSRHEANSALPLDSEGPKQQPLVYLKELQALHKESPSQSPSDPEVTVAENDPPSTRPST